MSEFSRQGVPHSRRRATVTGGTMTIGSMNTSGVLDVQSYNGDGITLDGVTVHNEYGAIVVGDVTDGTTLTLDDGAAIDGGTLTIGSTTGDQVAIEAVSGGSNNPGATFDDVSVQIRAIFKSTSIPG